MFNVVLEQPLWPFNDSTHSQQLKVWAVHVARTHRKECGNAPMFPTVIAAPIICNAIEAELAAVSTGASARSSIPSMYLRYMNCFSFILPSFHSTSKGTSLLRPGTHIAVMRDEHLLRKHFKFYVWLWLRSPTVGILLKHQYFRGPSRLNDAESLF